LLEPARRLPERRFVVAGAMYPADFPWRDNVSFVRHIPAGEHPAFFGSSRITLNVTRDAMARLGWCPQARVFEAAASGTPVLSDQWPGLEDFFEPGCEILVARTTDDAVTAVERPAVDLTRIGSAARRRVLAQHTVAHRARELVALLGGRARLAAGA
jgi:spore maturation protein CgeB